jgi:hypothetical protein
VGGGEYLPPCPPGDSGFGSFDVPAPVPGLLVNDGDGDVKVFGLPLGTIVLFCITIGGSFDGIFMGSDGTGEYLPPCSSDSGAFVPDGDDVEVSFFSFFFFFAAFFWLFMFNESILKEDFMLDDLSTKDDISLLSTTDGIGKEELTVAIFFDLST